YLTANPRSAYTLSELSAALDVSPASMSAVLLSMTDAGYLARHPRHRTYELGTSAVALGNAAAVRHPVVELAHRAMVELTDSGLSCVGSAVVGDDMVVLAVTGPATQGTREIRL